MKATMKILSVLLALLLCTAILTGCTGSSSPEKTGPDSGTEKPALTGVEAKIEDMKQIKDIKKLKPSNGRKLKIAMVGDSITEGVGVENKASESYPAQMQAILGKQYDVGNFGKSGAFALSENSPYNVKPKSNYYPNTVQYTASKMFNPDVVVIMLGINDIRSLTCDEAKEQFKASLARLAKEYCEMESVQKVYIATPVFVPKDATLYQFAGGLQDLEKEIAAEIGLDVIDIYEMTKDYLNVLMHYTKDRLHPEKQAYKEIARACCAVLLGEDFVPEKAEASENGVVYLKTDGRVFGKGETPDTAVNSFAKAVGLLRDGGGTIVICGPYDVEYEMHMPWNEGTITVTTSYGGVDYAQSARARLGLANGLYLNGDYRFENLPIQVKMENALIACNYNNVTFGSNIQTTLASGITAYPILLAGHNVSFKGARVEDLTLHGECTIVIDSGVWASFLGSNRRTDLACPVAGSDKDAKLNITINGGEFVGQIAATQDGNTAMEGTVTLTVASGLKSKVSGFANVIEKN